MMYMIHQNTHKKNQTQPNSAKRPYVLNEIIRIRDLFAQGQAVVNLSLAPPSLPYKPRQMGVKKHATVCSL